MVHGVNCASCSVGLRRELTRLSGVLAIREGTSKQHLLVDFDASRVSPEAVLDATHRAGFEAEMLVSPGSGCAGNGRPC